MLREGQPIGASAYIVAKSGLSPTTNRIVKAFADQAVIAIENVRLFESVEARTRELAASLEDYATRKTAGADAETRLARSAHRRYRA